MAGIQIVRVDPLVDDELFDGWVAASVESGEYEFGEWHTAYSAQELRAAQRLSTDCLILRLAAVKGDVVAGQATLTLPLLDNRQTAELALSVRPAYRRQGIGTRLLDELESLATAHARNVLRAESQVAAGRPDPADPFATARGYTAELVDLRSDLDLRGDLRGDLGLRGDLNRPMSLDALLGPLEEDAATRAGAYEVLTWWDDVPDVWVDQRADLASRMSTDTPMGGLLVQQEAWDGDRLREQIQILHAQGRRLVETVAVERASGRLVAFTDLVVSAHTPRVAYQWDTLVRKEHRGRRLGQLVKSANLRALLRELPGISRVVTYNAQVKEPMLRVNRAMGFTTVGVMTQWQKILP